MKEYKGVSILDGKLYKDGERISDAAAAKIAGVSSKIMCDRRHRCGNDIRRIMADIGEFYGNWCVAGKSKKAQSKRSDIDSVSSAMLNVSLTDPASFNKAWSELE